MTIGYQFHDNPTLARTRVTAHQISYLNIISISI